MERFVYATLHPHALPGTHRHKGVLCRPRLIRCSPLKGLHLFQDNYEFQ